MMNPTTSSLPSLPTFILPKRIVNIGNPKYREAIIPTSRSAYCQASSSDARSGGANDEHNFDFLASMALMASAQPLATCDRRLAREVPSGLYPLTSARTVRSRSALPGCTEIEGSSWRKNQCTVQVAVAPGAKLA